jgi:hypothetical protein
VHPNGQNPPYAERFGLGGRAEVKTATPNPTVRNASPEIVAWSPSGAPSAEAAPRGAALNDARAAASRPVGSALLRNYQEWAPRLAELRVAPHTVVVQHRQQTPGLRAAQAVVDGAPRIVLVASVTEDAMPDGLRALMEDAGAQQVLASERAEGEAVLARAAPLAAAATDNRQTFAQAQRFADRLLSERGISHQAGDRQLMRFTLARSLFDGLTPEALAFIDAHPEVQSWSELTSSNLLSPRGHFKSERLLTHPYTQEQAMQRLDGFERLFADLARQLHRRANGTPYTLWLGGSAAKGRYSADSDLDLYIETDDLELRQAGTHKTGVTLAENERQEFQVAAATHPHGAINLGDGLAVVREPGKFRSIFAEQAQGFGLRVDAHAGTATIAGSAGADLHREQQFNLDHRLVHAGPSAWPMRSRHGRAVRDPSAQWLTLDRLRSAGTSLREVARAEGLSDEALKTALSSRDADNVAVPWISRLDAIERLALDWALAT